MRNACLPPPPRRRCLPPPFACWRASPHALWSTTPVQVHCGSADLHFHGSLLQLRGHAPSNSPIADAAGSVLLFNGQVFGGGLQVPPGASDAQLLLQALGRPGADVPALLTSLRGPWALVYWHAPTCTLWFGRDLLGEPAGLLGRSRLQDPLPALWAAHASWRAHHWTLIRPAVTCRPAQPAAAPPPRRRRPPHAGLSGAAGPGRSI